MESTSTSTCSSLISPTVNPSTTTYSRCSKEAFINWVVMSAPPRSGFDSMIITSRVSSASLVSGRRMRWRTPSRKKRPGTLSPPPSTAQTCSSPKSKDSALTFRPSGPSLSAPLSARKAGRRYSEKRDGVWRYIPMVLTPLRSWTKNSRTALIRSGLVFGAAACVAAGMGAL